MYSDGVAALLAAAGQGERLGRGAKAFLVLDGCTLLEHVVGVLEKHATRIIAGVPEELVEQARHLLGERAVVLAGGRSRQETIRKLYDHSSEPLVVTHNVTTPFASSELLARVIAEARQSGAAVPFLHPHIPAGLPVQDKVVDYIARSDILLPQSPQCYRREVFERALVQAEAQGVETQATWQLIVMAGVPVTVVEGEECNIKITTPFDWEVAQKVIWPLLKGKK